MYGAPNTKKSKKMMLLGGGELGKEVVIEAQRLGVETIVVDRYEHAPAMQVAHRSYCINMLDEAQLRATIESEKPDLIVPEIEAIATHVLAEYEQQGYHIVPTALATQLTMDREGIRRLAAEQLHLPTAKYEFATSLEELKIAIEIIGLPCVIKPIMSSSGKGQSVCRTLAEIESCWQTAVEGGRAQSAKVIVEQFITFESEITLLTIRSVSGTTFCLPIGHIQKDGDYIESWQPHEMTTEQINEAQEIARKVTDALGGYGLYGVELFLTNDGVVFSEVSPRPHDTGLVTLITQDLSEFALHVRAILGLPIPEIKLFSAGATRTLKADRDSEQYEIDGVFDALSEPNVQVRLFGKPVTKPGRRMAVVMCSAETVELAREKASLAQEKLKIRYER
jgi:phosphoribosylglycinamide formyltransferase 2